MGTQKGALTHQAGEQQSKIQPQKKKKVLLILVHEQLFFEIDF